MSGAKIRNVVFFLLPRLREVADCSKPIFYHSGSLTSIIHITLNLSKTFGMAWFENRTSRMLLQMISNKLKFTTARRIV